MAFETGQRVRVREGSAWSGDTGTITGRDWSFDWTVRMDDGSYMTDENGNSWFNEDELAAVSKFKVGEKVRLAENNGYIELGPEGIVLSTEGPNPSYPYKVVVVQPDGTVDALAFAEDELEAI